MRVKHVSSLGVLSDSIITSAKEILTYIKSKVTYTLGENPVATAYDQDFWYDLDLSNETYPHEPSHRCEVGFDEIMKWYQRNRKFLKEPTTKKKLDPIDVSSDDEYEEENEVHTVEDND